MAMGCFRRRQHKYGAVFDSNGFRDKGWTQGAAPLSIGGVSFALFVRNLTMAHGVAEDYIVKNYL